jgi:hypothetical protein
MLKKVFKSGVHGLLGKVPSKVLEAPNFKGPWDNGVRFRRQTKRASLMTAI